MEVTNCTDINGNGLNEIKFNVDGTVVGVLDNNNGGLDSNLSYDCCLAQGYTFDPKDTKCYWSTTCLSGGTYNIVLDPEGNTGAFFQIDEGQEDICHLEVNLKFLLRFDCENLVNTDFRLRETLETLKLEFSLEKVIYDDNLPIPNNLENVITTDLFNVTDITNFFDGNTNTGILLNGDCGFIENNLLTDLQPNSDIITDLSLNSDWVTFKLVIDDPTILQSIYNERLKLSIIGNKLINFAILIDDVQLNRVCDVENPPSFLDKECPKFELSRFIDNKKSWVSNEEYNVRNFDLERRLTGYPINDERLSINTKEVDLAINPAQAIEDDVLAFAINSPCILAPKSGCTSGDTSHSCVDISKLITTEDAEGVDFINQFIDVKNRKTLSAYPTIDLLYHRYLNSLEHCGVDSNALDLESINTFVDLIGNYWSDLIEQVVPATTIWGSSLTNSGNVFAGGGGSGVNKFVYRKYSALLCDSIYYPVQSPVKAESGSGKTSTVDVGVYTEDITEGDSSTIGVKLTQTCNSLTIRQLNCGSEFIGTISVIGGGEGPTTGSTISITETIDEVCDKFEDC